MFLEVDDAVVTAAPNDEVHDLIVELAAGSHTVEQIAERLQTLIA